jgi:hypothetical protein
VKLSIAAAAFGVVLGAAIAVVGQAAGAPAPRAARPVVRAEQHGLERGRTVRARLVTGPAFEPPSAESPRPHRREWKSAPLIALARAPDTCEARAIREWVRVSCHGPLEAMLVGGSHEGVDLYQGNEWDPPIHVVFPVRRGDRRVIQLYDVERTSRYQPLTVSSGGTIVSESWTPDEGTPTIVVDG